MKYFIDLDNTLCYTSGNNYEYSKPILERIKYVSDLKALNHHITIWTARGSESGKDYTEITKKQLKDWNVPYDELLMGKPCYDCYIDDKSFNVDDFWTIPQKNNITKKKKHETVMKGWGKEIIFVNNNDYCGKILCFNKGKKFSMHYHLLKKETWYVSKGEFIFIWINTNDGIKYSEYLNVGDIITNERGEPHQLIALEDGEIIEVSTQHFDKDSYRIWKGD